MHAGCWVELPREIMLRKRNQCAFDRQCVFRAWSVVAALYPMQSHVNRKSSYPDYTTVLNLEGIEFPVTLKQITKFELLNDISINVFTERKRGGKKDGGNVIVPLRLTKEKKEKHVNLLYLQESRRDDDETLSLISHGLKICHD